MADNGSVVDELVVNLKLNAEPYKKSDKEVDQLVTKTEKKRARDGDKAKQRETASIKRTKEATSAAKTFGVALRSLAIGVAGVLGVGSAAGIVTAVVALAGMETNLRRAAVSTNLSNREMQAWGATAKRLGADAQAGAAAIADLAKEQQQFNITGQAPTMMALARLGIRASPDTPVADMLSQAQQVYRGSSPAQQKQIESSLAAQGVSSDLILMIKSETDAREAYTKSYAESATENRKALDAVTDALSSAASAAVNIANTIATVAEPGIKAFTEWVSKGSIALSNFNDRVIASGGGLDGFIKVAGEDFPKATTELLREFRVMGEAVDVVSYGLDILGKNLKAGWEWLTGHAPSAANPDKDRLKPALEGKYWDSLVAKARTALGISSTTPAAPAASPGAAAKGTNAQDLMSTLVTKYGLTVPQAAAIATSAGKESGFNPGAFNPAGGGNGARGLFQLRGARSQAFLKKYGVLPDGASIDQQLDFMFNDPYERGLLNKSIGGGGDANALGASFSDVFEAHGNAAETARRGREAARLANAYQPGAGNATGGGGPNINIATVNVAANNPSEFVGSIQRVTGPQNYNAGQR
jgi:hypothetical protein